MEVEVVLCLRLLRVEEVLLQLVEVILRLSPLLVDSVLDGVVAEEEEGEGDSLVAVVLIFILGIEEMMPVMGEAGILVLAVVGGGMVVVEEEGGMEGEVRKENWIILHFQSRILGIWYLSRRISTLRILRLGLCLSMKW
jgi:hypothetical protein